MCSSKRKHSIPDLLLYSNDFRNHRLSTNFLPQKSVFNFCNRYALLLIVLLMKLLSLLYKTMDITEFF